MRLIACIVYLFFSSAFAENKCSVPSDIRGIYSASCIASIIDAKGNSTQDYVFDKFRLAQSSTSSCRLAMDEWTVGVDVNLPYGYIGEWRTYNYNNEKLVVYADYISSEDLYLIYESVDRAGVLKMRKKKLQFSNGKPVRYEYEQKTHGEEDIFSYVCDVRELMFKF